jgi:hypothetical protein
VLSSNASSITRLAPPLTLEVKQLLAHRISASLNDGTAMLALALLLVVELIVRRGDAMSPTGTKLPTRNVHAAVAIRGKADNICSM